MANKLSAGSGSHAVVFKHRDEELTIHTGVDNVSWGYGLNVQRYPTYGGEVIQILSAYVDDLEVAGTLATYQDMETAYSFFLKYIQRASTEGTRDENPMTFIYPHRGWSFKIMVTEAPGYRKARDLTVPNWRIRAHVVDEEGDVDSLSELITSEAQMKLTVGQDENFGLEGVIRFVDENPFSDPQTKAGADFDPGSHMDKITDFYSKLLPAYMEGDFDAVFGGIGSTPAFKPPGEPPKSGDDDDKLTEAAKLADEIRAANKVGGKK